MSTNAYFSAKGQLKGDLEALEEPGVVAFSLRQVAHALGSRSMRKDIVVNVVSFGVYDELFGRFNSRFVEMAVRHPQHIEVDMVMRNGIRMRLPEQVQNLDGGLNKAREAKQPHLDGELDIFKTPYPKSAIKTADFQKDVTGYGKTPARQYRNRGRPVRMRIPYDAQALIQLLAIPDFVRLCHRGDAGGHAVSLFGEN